MLWAMSRPYADIARQVDDNGTAAARMQRVADLIWETCGPLGVSWVGFYLPGGDDALILGPARNKPACSPIGLHGACGQAFLSRKPLIVRDVADLGDGYIACDPRDRSEVVIPLLDDDGAALGVLDLDSYDVGAFDAADVTGLTAVLRAAGLTRGC